MSIINITRSAGIEETTAEMDRRGRVIEQLEARLAHIDGIYKGAIDNLNHHQTQLDMDGVMVGVSRQALCEVLTALENAFALSQPAAVAQWRDISSLQSQLDAVREAAAVAGWNACRRSIYAVCEDVQNEAKRLRTSSKPGTFSEEEHARGYYAGSCYAAKSIARGFNSMSALDDDNLRATLNPTSEKNDG